ncbi:hypothetical protein ACP4OV_008866 [Aristida adscensionis]
MDLRGLRDLVASLFIMLNKKTYILFRVEFLVVVVTVLFLAMFIMDIFRRHFHNRFMKAIFRLFDVASDSILVYLLGAMQSEKLKNELFPVWALVLIIFRFSVGFISGYGAPDHGGKHLMKFRNGMNLLWTLILNLTHGSKFLLPLLSLLSLQMLRTLYTLTSHILANNSYWHGRSSELISEYMHGSNWKPEKCKPETMDGYKYLVYGESRVILKKPQYALFIGTSSTSSQKKNGIPPHSYAQGEDTISSKMITLDKIWQCYADKLEGANNPHAKELMDHSLAFALSRLLRARLEDVTLEGHILQINKNLVKARIIEERDDERAIGIMELQLAFVNDYFHTRYPMVFWLGLKSLCFSLLQSLVTIIVIGWLSVDIRKVYKPPKGDLAHVVLGINVETIITWAFMLFVLFKEIWEMVTYLLSDWTRLLLVCRFASCDDGHVRNHCMERLMLCLFRSKINAKRWHKHLDQYFFLQSYHDRPRFCNFIRVVTTGMIPKKDDGAKLSHAIDVPEYVRSAALEKIRAIMDLKRHCSKDVTESSADGHRNLEKTADKDGCGLPKVIMTLCKGNRDRMKQYGWACFNLQTSSHVILVWHIATSLCEMALAKKHGVDLSKPGFLHSLVSCFTGCCSSKPYLIDVNEQRKEKNRETNLMGGDGIDSSKSGFMCSLLSCFTGCCSSSNAGDKLTGELRKRYIIANSVSRYCTYLLVSKPDLIPDSFLVPKMVFQTAVRSARDDILEGCDSLESRYSKLMEIAENAAPNSSDVKKGDDVVRQGAILAKELDNETDERCWEILSGVWTELLIHLAPTWNAEAHKKCLKSGGEYITNIWALLWHCGIEKSNLWPADDASENETPAAPENSCAGNSRTINISEDTPKTAEDGSDHLTEVKIHRVDEIEETEEPVVQLKDQTKGRNEGYMEP